MNFPPNTPRVRSLASITRQRATVCGVLVFGVGLSLLLFKVMRDSESREIQAEFEAIAHQRVELLRESLGTSIVVLHALGGLYKTGLTVDREHFRRYVEPAIEHRHELQALSWSPRVEAGDREEFERTMRAEGFSDFEIRAWTTRSGSPGRAPDHDGPYFPIVMVEPFERNRDAFGIDIMASSGTGTAARALEAGTAVSTSIILLLQEATNQPGFAVQLPLFDGAVPDTVEERRAKCTGFVSAVFRVADLVDPAFTNLEGMTITLSDPNPGNRSVTFTPDASDDRPASTFLSKRTFELMSADRTLMVEFTPTVGFESQRNRSTSWTILGFGLLLTVLSTVYLRNGQRRSREIARANQELQAEVIERIHAEEEAATANRAKSSFVSHLSHEIRTPLNAILGYAQILDRDRNLPARHHESINAIAQSGEHLLGLLSSVLDLSRIEAGHVQLDRVPFDLPRLIESLGPMFLPKASEKNIRICFECLAPVDRGSVLGDVGKLRQVLINLISNAMKFTRNGKVQLRVTLGREDRWTFEVIDSGAGILEHDRQRLFRPFYQTVEGRKEGGSGLGLAISRGHVQAMGGQLEFESKRGLGTRFFFTLPFPAAVVSASSQLQRHIPRLGPGIRLNALVIDDSRDNRQILAHLLGDIGCMVAATGTASGALDLARQSRPDILFIDVFLSDTTGPELLARLREEGLPRKTPVVLHTAALLTRERNEELRSDGVELLQKPFSVEDLCSCIERVCGIRFVREIVQTAGSTSGPLPDPARIPVPSELRERMMNAAGIHNSTALKACLKELRTLGESSAVLAEHLRRLLHLCDFASICEIVARLAVDGECDTAHAVHAGSHDYAR